MLQALIIGIVVGCGFFIAASMKKGSSKMKKPSRIKSLTTEVSLEKAMKTIIQFAQNGGYKLDDFNEVVTKRFQLSQICVHGSKRKNNYGGKRVKSVFIPLESMIQHRIVLPIITLLGTLLCSICSAQTISIQLAENPVIDSIPSQWRGYNQGAKSLITEVQTTDFANAFNRLDPGIVRWPGGNFGNNYRWQDHLEENNRLNLKNMILFLDTFNLELQVVVNFGNGSASEAAEFVRLCNHTNSYYTTLRNDLLNTSDPINVKYWEIGNESTDAWSYGWSWLGFQENVHFQTGVPVSSSTHYEADSLYYYGGELFREGWVLAIGGLDNNTAILGDLKFYSNALATDTISVEYPLLDITDTNAVRVYRTHNFDNVWAHNVATQQQLYDSIANPNNLLSAGEFSWTTTDVILNPNGGLLPNDLLLIEYNSIGHDGAFAFRDSMKAADPTIEIGYTVSPDSLLASNTIFQQDFANSPPDFMIKHPYASGLTIPALDQGLYSEAAYVSQKKATGFVALQELWDQREQDWQIATDIGLSLTEWNVALFDLAPADHPIRGITCGMYVADFWARCFDLALNDSIDLRAMNHFALAAQGNNFIHLLHTNPTFSVGVEGKATTMVMEAVGQGMFPITVTNNPQINVLTNSGQQVVTVAADAIPAWAGIGADPEYINLLLINRDDENPHTVEIHIPPTWQADSIQVQSLYGTMDNDTVFTTSILEQLAMSTYTITLPEFSVNTLRIHLPGPLTGVHQNTSKEEVFVYPNPSNGDVHIDFKSVKTNGLISIFNSVGKLIAEYQLKQAQFYDLKLPDSNGLYLIHITSSDGTFHTSKIIKQ